MSGEEPFFRILFHQEGQEDIAFVPQSSLASIPSLHPTAKSELWHKIEPLARFHFDEGGDPQDMSISAMTTSTHFIPNRELQCRYPDDAQILSEKLGFPTAPRTAAGNSSTFASQQHPQQAQSPGQSAPHRQSLQSANLRV